MPDDDVIERACRDPDYPMVKAFVEKYDFELVRTEIMDSLQGLRAEYEEYKEEMRLEDEKSNVASVES